MAYFLRKVLWTVRGFTIDTCRQELRAMYEDIDTHGSFVSHAERFLIQARKPLERQRQ